MKMASMLSVQSHNEKKMNAGDRYKHPFLFISTGISHGVFPSNNSEHYLKVAAICKFILL